MNSNDLKSNLELICGVNPVYSLLKTNAGKRKIYEIYLSRSKQSDIEAKEIIILAKEKKVKLSILEDKSFEKLANNLETMRAQGVCAKVSNYTYCDLDDFLAEYAGKEYKLVVLDGITDVGNFGAIIRSAFAFCFDGIIIPKHRSVEINKSVNRASAGYLEEIRIIKVHNLIRAIKLLKESGSWIYGTCIENDRNVVFMDKAEFMFPMTIILGSEHKGISRLSKENSDFLLKIGMNKEIDSLNVSVAAGIIFHEVYKSFKNRKI